MAPSYSTNDPKGWGGDPRRGAALGRGSHHATDKDAPVKLYLRRVPLDSGGYDKNGTYFGIKKPLYWCADKDGDIDFVFHAYSREGAKDIVCETYKNARFYQ